MTQSNSRHSNFVGSVFSTRLSSRRQTRATRCLAPIVLNRNVEVHCDKLATDYCRQFIILSVHLS